MVYSVETGQVFWFATRGAGIMTWATAMVSIVLGLLLASKVLGRKPGFPWLLDLHRFVSGLSVVFLGIHMATLWADSYVHFGWAELLIPFMSETQNGAVAWGVIAAWILAAVQASSLLKRFLPKRIWHGMHLGAYVVAVFGTIHGWQAGSDVNNRFVLLVVAASWALIITLTLVRVRALLAPRLDRVDRGLDKESLRVRSDAQS